MVALAPVPPGGKSPKPILSEGHSLAELEVPEQYTDASLLDIHKGLRVDVKSSRLVVRG